MQDSIIFPLKGQSYNIAFPTVGQYRDIQIAKQNLSMNNYGGLFRSMLTESEDALDMIDIEANLSILCPELIKVLKVPFSELGLLDYTEIRKVYREVFEPWWSEIMKILRPQPLNAKVEVNGDKES